MILYSTIIKGHFAYYEAVNDKDTLHIFRIIYCFIYKFLGIPYYVLPHMQFRGIPYCLLLYFAKFLVFRIMYRVICRFLGIPYYVPRFLGIPYYVLHYNMQTML